MFKILITFGISKENFDKTAIDYAKEENYIDIVKLLSKSQNQEE